MKSILNEAFVVSKGTDHKGNLIAYVDPTKPENKETFKYKDIFKNRGARWGGKFWFWYIGKTEDQWRKVYSSFIEPALKDVHKLEGAPEEESKSSLVASLDAIVGEIQAATTTNDPTSEKELTPEEKKALLEKLSKFKETIVNIDNDEEFKKTMQIVMTFKNAQGHSYSFWNSILVLIQNPKATLVKSEFNWNRFHRTIIDKSQRMAVRSPSKAALRPYSKQEKEKITAKFLASVGKKTFAELGPGERERLGIMLRGAFGGHSFEVTYVYDVANTKQMEGKEDYVTDLIDKRKEVKWFEENMISEEVRPIYQALLDFAAENEIKIEIIDDLNGSRGVSKSGLIGILRNEGNDVGLTKTLAHELSHELLHQTYLKGKNSKFSQYFVGAPEGREAVEQQAEIAAWMIMGMFDFNLKTTSINYAVLWGADKEAMVKVFDTVSGVVSMLVDYISRKTKKPVDVPQNEVAGDSRVVTPMDVARFIGVEKEYQDVLNQSKGAMVENFYNIYKKIL